MRCDGCNNPNAYQSRTFWVEVLDEHGVKTGQRNKVEVCNKCGDASPDYPRDALGNKVSIPLSDLGKFSYATGTEMTSTRQYANVLKQMNLGQKER